MDKPLERMTEVRYSPVPSVVRLEAHQIKANVMTPSEAAETLVRQIPKGFSVASLKEYGVDVTQEQAQVIAREILTLNLFWIILAIEAHISKQYRTVVSELVLNSIEHAWSTVDSAGFITWNEYTTERKERVRRYERLVQEGVSPLAISAELGMILEEQRVVREENRRNVLTLLIDSVPVETYREILKDAG